MITICTGWKRSHPTVVLKPEDSVTPGTSHGICPQCEADMMVETLRREPCYAVYLENPVLDPRD